MRDVGCLSTAEGKPLPFIEGTIIDWNGKHLVYEAALIPARDGD